ncbi:putative Thioredoxin-like superfamily [Helianthus debilis subsp. tardiflorus]
MAPTKRKSDDKPETASENNKPTRVTRSSTRQATQATTKPVAEPLAPKAKKAKLTSKQKPEPKPKTTEAPAANGGDGSKTIVIEHCTQCKQFKIRAVKVKDDLESAVSGINVLVNPEKPRRGCFEVREEGGKKFVSLLDMKRPFGPMKALDMDAVISDIIDQIK